MRPPLDMPVNNLAEFADNQVIEATIINCLNTSLIHNQDNIKECEEVAAEKNPFACYESVCNESVYNESEMAGTDAA